MKCADFISDSEPKALRNWRQGVLEECCKCTSGRTVIGGLVLQLIAALVLLGIPGANRVMFLLNDAASALNRATEAGTGFVFGYLAGPRCRSPSRTRAPVSSLRFRRCRWC
jgi:hypothetical protein